MLNRGLYYLRIMEIHRCPWVKVNNPVYVDYHDREWGVPVFDDRKIFEFLVLESSQAGVSWEVVLNKREAYRKAFLGFDPQKVASFSKAEIEVLLMDAGIIRNRAKIEAAVSNARQFLRLAEKHGSFRQYIWGFIDGKPIVNYFNSIHEVPITTPLSDKIATELRKEGFKFLGSTTIYAHMQATGMVNDHLTMCFRHRQIIELLNEP